MTDTMTTQNIVLSSWYTCIWLKSEVHECVWRQHCPAVCTVPCTCTCHTHRRLLLRNFYFYQYIVVFLINTVIYVFLLLGLCILIVQLSWMRFIRAFSSVVRQKPGYNSPRRGTARTVPITFCVVLCIVFVLFYVLHVWFFFVGLCIVCVYCTTATGCQPNCS
jgi:hypothetical protein